MGAWAVSEAARRYGDEAAQGVAARLLPEEQSLSTAESAQNTAVLLQSHGLTSAGVVTDTFHMPRVRYLFAPTFRRHHLEFRPLPAPGLLRDYWRRGRLLRLGKFVLREGGAWVKLWSRQVW